ncbi:MAG: TerB family tellurite resistance protein [Desulfomonilaceae bacterium]
MSKEEHPLAGYPDSEKSEYLCAVASIINVDKPVSDMEIDYLRDLSKTVKLSDKSIGKVITAAYDPDGNPTKEFLERISGREIRFTLVTDLIFMAYADDDIVDAEVRYIKSIAVPLKVNDDQVAAMRKYVEAVREASKSGSSKTDWKDLGGEILASLASVGVPIAAIAVSGTIYGLSGAGIVSGLAALGLGLGMTGGVAVVVGIGLGTYKLVKWLYEEITEG